MAAAVALAGLAAIWPAAQAIDALDAARAVRAEARAAAAAATRPIPASPAAIRLADTQVAATARLAELVRREALRSGLLVEQLHPLRPRPRWLAGVKLRLSGSEKAVLGAVERLERDQPLVRLVAWRIAADADDHVTLDATLAGAWR